jgi:hypothetical protein
MFINVYVMMILIFNVVYKKIRSESTWDLFCLLVEKDIENI